MFVRIEIRGIYLELGQMQHPDTSTAPPADTPYPMVEDRTWPDDTFRLIPDEECHGGR